jgi:putative colanic acid biosynthesis acetyltransferase WcaF
VSHQLDIKANRAARKYSRYELMLRVLWVFGAAVFKCTPRAAFKFRCSLLKLFGATIGTDVHIYSSATIYMPWNLEVGNLSSIGELAYVYNLGKVRIGSRVAISHRAHLCAGTHDYNSPDLPLLKPPITISDQAWICADAFIGPGTVVGEGAVVGARAVVMRDVPAWAVVAGNPAVVIKQRHLGHTGD